VWECRYFPDTPRSTLKPAKKPVVLAREGDNCDQLQRFPKKPASRGLSFGHLPGVAAI
jgi:hypothetical protein